MKPLLWVATWLCVLAWPGRILGALTATVQLAGTGADSVSVDPGASFTIEVWIDTDQVIVSAEMSLRASSAGVLAITSGAYGELWSPTWAYDVPVGDLAPSSVTPFGSLPLADTFGPGSSVLITMEILVNALAEPGSYTLNVETVLGGDTEFMDFAGLPGPDFTVTVTGDEPPPDDPPPDDDPPDEPPPEDPPPDEPPPEDPPADEPPVEEPPPADEPPPQEPPAAPGDTGDQPITGPAGDPDDADSGPAAVEPDNADTTGPAEAGPAEETDAPASRGSFCAPNAAQGLVTTLAGLLTLAVRRRWP